MLPLLPRGEAVLRGSMLHPQQLGENSTESEILLKRVPLPVLANTHRDEGHRRRVIQCFFM